MQSLSSLKANDDDDAAAAEAQLWDGMFCVFTHSSSLMKEERLHR
jgi:hypothetical protein